MSGILKARNCKEAAQLLQTADSNNSEGYLIKIISIEKPPVTIEGVRFKSHKLPDVENLAKAEKDKLISLILGLAKNRQSFISDDGNSGHVLWRLKKENYDEVIGRTPVKLPKATLSAVPDPRDKKVERRDRLTTIKTAAQTQKQRGRPQKDKLTAEEIRGKFLADIKVLEHKKVRVARIRPFAGQPRSVFHEETIGQLGVSIKERQLEEVTVMIIENDPKHDFELVNGERRWRAAQKAGLEWLDVKICAPMDKKQQFLYSAVSNFGQERHTELDEAEAFARIKKDYGLTEQELARMFFKTQSLISQRLNLLRLDKRVRQMLMEERLDVSIAGFLVSKVMNSNQQFAFAKEIVKRGLNLNQARHLIRLAAYKQGMQLNSRTRKQKPVEDYRNFQRFLQRFSDEAEIYLAMPDEIFEKMFASRKLEEVQGIHKDVEKISKKITAILDRLLIQD